MPKLRNTLPFALALAACGCGDQPVPTPAVAVAEPVGGLVPGTPPGDLEQWVKDVQVGLDTVEMVLATDREGANRRALNLYTGRQEYMEMYYGVGARMKPTEALSQAVTVAETRFHELITLTGGTPPAAEADVRKAIAAVRAQFEVVLAEAKHSPARLRHTETGKEQQ